MGCGCRGSKSNNDKSVVRSAVPLRNTGSGNAVPEPGAVTKSDFANQRSPGGGTQANPVRPIQTTQRAVATNPNASNSRPVSSPGLDRNSAGGQRGILVNANALSGAPGSSNQRPAVPTPSQPGRVLPGNPASNPTSPVQAPVRGPNVPVPGQRSTHTSSINSVLLDKSSCKKLASDTGFLTRFPELTGRAMPYEEYRKGHSGTGCTECTWGSAMAEIIQNETINNPGFRNRLLRDLQASNIKILKNGRIHSFSL